VITLPPTIWEQAGVIALFVVSFIALVVILVKALIQLIESAIKLIGVVKGIISETNTSFQEFIKQQNQQWQAYLTDLRQDDNRASSQIASAVGELTNLIKSMQQFDAQHHTAMTTAINAMERTVARKTRPTSRGGD
jgi:predicted PurR-regulated permease PerM